MCIVLFPIQFDGTNKPDAISKIRTDYLVYMRTREIKKPVFVITGFEQMRLTAKTMINTGFVVNAKFKEMSAFNALPHTKKSAELFSNRMYRTEKDALAKAIHFNPEKIKEEFKKIIELYKEYCIIFVSHALATDTVMLEYAKMHNIKIEEIMNFLPVPGDSVFLNNGKIEFRRKNINPSVFTYKYRGDRID